MRIPSALLWGQKKGSGGWKSESEAFRDLLICCSLSAVCKTLFIQQPADEICCIDVVQIMLKTQRVQS